MGGRRGRGKLVRSPIFGSAGGRRLPSVRRALVRGWQGAGPLWGICELRAVAGRGGEVLVLFIVSPLTDQVSPELRAESGKRFECARGGLGGGLDRCGDIIAVVAVAGRGGEDCFLFTVFPADSIGVGGAARRERFQSAPSTWWFWRGSGPL